MNEWMITTAVTLGIGVITYFLKRTMSQVDGQGNRIGQVETGKADRQELKESTEELKQEIKQIREDYTPKKVHEKEFDECRADIRQIRENYLTKDDFIREISKMDRKLDRLMEMRIEETKKG